MTSMLKVSVLKDFCILSAVAGGRPMKAQESPELISGKSELGPASTIKAAIASALVPEDENHGCFLQA